MLRLQAGTAACRLRYLTGVLFELIGVEGSFVGSRADATAACVIIIAARVHALLYLCGCAACSRVPHGFSWELLSLPLLPVAAASSCPAGTRAVAGLLCLPGLGRRAQAAAACWWTGVSCSGSRNERLCSRGCNEAGTHQCCRLGAFCLRAWHAPTLMPSAVAEDRAQQTHSGAAAAVRPRLHPP